jgi:hypothetical protein
MAQKEIDDIVKKFEEIDNMLYSFFQKVDGQDFADALANLRRLEDDVTVALKAAEEVGAARLLRRSVAVMKDEYNSGEAECIAAIEAHLAGKAPLVEPDYETRHKLSDLLDLYREEVACKQYNGWVRRRQPDDIRKDIDAEIERLTGG